jgi:hypothetical protein
MEDWPLTTNDRVNVFAPLPHGEGDRSIDKGLTPSYVSVTSPTTLLCVGSAVKSAVFMVHGGTSRNACGDGTRALRQIIAARYDQTDVICAP